MQDHLILHCKVVQNRLRNKGVVNNVENFHIERKDHMKKKENRVMSFRFDDHILSKIDYLMEEDKKKLAKMGIPPRTRKELIEGIIENYYLREITKTRDPDVVKRIEMMVNDAADTRFKEIEGKINELLYLTIKSDLGKKVLYRSPSVLPAPKDIDQAVRILVNEESAWDNALEKIMKDDYLIAQAEEDSYYEDDD